LPIVLVSIKNLSYNISIPEKSGFQFVTYSSDGTNPSYDKSNPFEVRILNNGTDVSENNNTTYTWNIKGAIYEDNSWKEQSLLTVSNNDSDALNKN